MASRGWAFLGVLAVHCGQLLGPFPGKALVAAGQQGVTLFFVASALTLALSARARTRTERRPTRNYFLRRFFRIAPLFWAGIVFYRGWHGSGPQFWAPAGVRPTYYALAAGFLHGWHPVAANSVVPGGWSIGVEMTFYLLVPPLLRYLTSLARILALLLASVPVSLLLGAGLTRALAPRFPDAERTLVDLFAFYWFPAQFPGFLVGFALFFLVTDAGLLARLRADGGWRAKLLLAGSLYGLFALAFAAGGPYAPPHVLYAVLFGAVALALAAWPHGVFVNATTRAAGVVSFSGYLTHFAVLDLLGPRVPPAGVFAAWLPAPASEAARFAVLYAASLGLTLAASTITYRLIERPGIALGRWLIAWSEANPTDRRRQTAGVGRESHPGV